MSTPDEEFDDFEYELAEPEPRTTCPYCGGQLGESGSCETCGQQLNVEPPGPPPSPDDPESEDAEARHEPGAQRPEGWAAYLEMEENEGDLPASFYAAALAVVVLVALIGIFTEAPGTAAKAIGLLTVVFGAVAVAGGYRWMSQQLEGGFPDQLAIPFRAVAGFFVKSEDPPPQAPSVDVAKWGLVAVAGGSLLWLAGVLIGLAY